MRCKCVYRNKLDAHGEIDKLKASFVVLGFSQKRIRYCDPNGICAQVVGLPAQRTMLAVMMSLPNITFDHWDATGSLVYGTVDEDFYMISPPNLQIPICFAIEDEPIWYKSSSCHLESADKR
jgi:hypothetical protein